MYTNYNKGNNKMNKLNQEIINGEFEETIEFHLMSNTLSSINFEDKITEGQYDAIIYFAKLHNVRPIDVIGKDGKKALSDYIDNKFNGYFDDKDNAKGATERFNKLKINSASELLSNSVPVNKFNPIDLEE